MSGAHVRRAARLPGSLSGGLPDCEEACQEGCCCQAARRRAAARRPLKGAARLPRGLCQKVSQEATRLSGGLSEGCQAVRRPVMRKVGALLMFIGLVLAQMHQGKSPPLPHAAPRGERRRPLREARGPVEGRREEARRAPRVRFGALRLREGALRTEVRRRRRRRRRPASFRAARDRVTGT